MTDSGYRSIENETKVHRQATISRIDEVSFMDIINNRDYYSIIDGERYYSLCSRCGYVPNDKIDINNTKYLDCHCKCGNPIQCVDISLDEIYYIIEREKQHEYQVQLFNDFYKKDLEVLDNEII